MFFIVKNHWEPSFTDNPRMKIAGYSILLITIYKHTLRHIPQNRNINIKRQEGVNSGTVGNKLGDFDFVQPFNDISTAEYLQCLVR
jgi:hypothetical protein